MAEFGRRVIHAAGAAVPALYVVGLVDWEVVAALVNLGVGVAIGLEYARLRRGFDWWIYRKLTREYEQHQVAGYALYMIGMAVVANVFQPWIAAPTMLMLALGDPVGGLLGRGGPGRKRLSVMGFVFAICFVIALPFAWEGVAPGVPAVSVAAAGALVAAVADGVPVIVRGRYVDDNLTIPIGAALAMWLSTVFVAA